MAAEPSLDDVDGFCSITTSHSHAEAVEWLKAYNNDVNRAVNAFFEDPDALRKQASHSTWEESHFHTDRTDNAQQSQNHRWQNYNRMGKLTHLPTPAFAIHPPDSLNSNVFADNISAPSRPPTRNSNRRNEWSPERDAGSNRQPTLAEQERAEVERAMAMSIGQGQETGVTDGGKSNFGIAKREYYDTNQWAMTYPAAHAQEILLNPVPADRMREPTAPAFLKPSPAEHRLPALIKILQAIPLSREALLNRKHTLPQYGSNPEWWDGVPMQLSRIVNISPDNQYNNDLEVVHEVQRLMAFLEKTDRAYGSADALVNVGGVRGSSKSQIIPNFLEQWRTATWHLDSDAALLDIFKNEGTKLSHYGDEVAEVPVFYMLQINVDQDIVDTGLSLYEAFDDILWSGTGDNDFEEVFLQTVADVFILEVSRQNTERPGLGIDIPGVWYSDRYLPSSKEQARAMQASKAAARKEIESIDRTMARLLEYTPPGPGKKPIRAADLLKAATAFFEKSVASTSITDETSEISESLPETSGPDLERYAAILQDLKLVADRVEQKIKTLEDLKAQAREKLVEISKLYTAPSSNPEEPPYHKYKLCGVCAAPHILYVLEETTKPDDEHDILSTEAEDWQWWKVSYDHRLSSPVSRMRVQELEVLTAAKDQCNTALLVYASEKATSFTPQDLPPQLQKFVREDNRNFAAEFDSPTSPKPTSPAKRKADDEDDEDAGSKLYRSPLSGKNSESSEATDLQGPTLPTYSSTRSPPGSLRQMTGPNQRKPRNIASYDDIIPTSLQATGSVVDPNSMVLDDSEGGHEMQDRGGGMGLLRREKEKKDQGGYRLGDYVPEIPLDDRDDDDVEEVQRIEIPMRENN